MIIRGAKPADVDYLAEACVEVVCFMRQETADTYISGFPDEVNADIIECACPYTNSQDKVAFIADAADGRKIGCLFGGIDQSNLPKALSGHVGAISGCWVEPDHRRSGIGRILLSEIESWFRSRGIRHLEVAYMAQNAMAREAWAHL
jgi:GNAT superfamily N-acetyltransferase